MYLYYVQFLCTAVHSFLFHFGEIWIKKQNYITRTAVVYAYTSTLSKHACMHVIAFVLKLPAFTASVVFARAAFYAPSPTDIHSNFFVVFAVSLIIK